MTEAPAGEMVGANFDHKRGFERLPFAPMRSVFHRLGPPGALPVKPGRSRSISSSSVSAGRSGWDRRGKAGMMQQALLRRIARGRARPTILLLLGIAETADDAVGHAPALDLDHRPLARAIFLLQAFCHRRRRARRRCAPDRRARPSRLGRSGETMPARPPHSWAKKRLERLRAAPQRFSRSATSHEAPSRSNATSPAGFPRRASGPGFRPDEAAAAARRKRARRRPE